LTFLEKIVSDSLSTSLDAEVSDTSTAKNEMSIFLRLMSKGILTIGMVGTYIGTFR
jgi:flagellar motor component MotA